MEREHGARVVWLPFDLHPEIPDEGVSVDRAFGGATPRREEYLKRLEELAEAADLPFDPPGWIPRTRMALEAAEWVRHVHPGSFDVFHRALFDAHWARGLDIGDREVIEGLAREAGVPPGQVEAAWGDPETREAVDRSTREALEAGVTGTPAWLLDGRLLVPGAQPRETFDRLMERMSNA